MRKRGKFTMEAAGSIPAASTIEAHSLEVTGRKFGLAGPSVYKLFDSRGLRCRTARTARQPLRLPAELVEAMWRDYEGGESQAKVAAKYGRDPRGLAEIFAKRGLKLRPAPAALLNRARLNGCWAPLVPATAEAIAGMIAGMKRPAVPQGLRQEWRGWPLGKRERFWRRVLKRFPAVLQASAPFSANVERFDYFSARARAIAAERNRGLPSNQWRVHLKLCSRGVIWQGELFFWAPKIGYQANGTWRPARERLGNQGRPSLHHLIWEQANGRAVPAGCVVRHRDGNVNNLAPENLALATRGEVAVETRGKVLLKASREKVAALLNSNRKGQNQNGIELVGQLVAASGQRRNGKKT